VAIRIHEELIDDLDGSTEHVTTHHFGLDNLRYEIDLSPANLQRLRAALAPFVAAGRRLPKTSTAKRRPATTRRSVSAGTAARTGTAR